MVRKIRSIGEGSPAVLLFVACSLAGGTALLCAQPPLTDIQLGTDRGLTVSRLKSALDSYVALPPAVPLFSLEIDQQEVSTLQAESVTREENRIRFLLPGGLAAELRPEPPFMPCWKARLILQNRTDQALAVSNMVPLGRGAGNTYITAAGPQTVPLARANLFRPEKMPVSVILPDNAWDLGYAAREAPEVSVCALARKVAVQNGEARRYRVTLQPGGTVEYALYLDSYAGSWQNGLRRMFRDHWLFDLEKFDNHIFQRADLAWIRRSFLVLLQFAWDRSFFDAAGKSFGLEALREEGRRWMGGYDVLGIWTTWPRLGLDDRNQWDLHRDLPGGTARLRDWAAELHREGTRLFVAYNPWDTGTRRESALDGLSGLIRETDADGVVLDTMASAGPEMQEALDAVKPGVVLYSEGMAAVKDMPGLPAGRVHDALELSPLLNLNKLIKPDYAIFRVCRLGDQPLHREIAVAFFNGYGVELNAFSPGNAAQREEDFRFLGRALRILRENASSFIHKDWEPLVPTRADGLWVNAWPGGGKKLYTIYSARPEGFEGPLLDVEPREGRHFVDLWNHREIAPLRTEEGKRVLPVAVEPFRGAWRPPRQEGSAGCVADLPVRIEASLDFAEGVIRVRAPSGPGRVLEIWKGAPSYEAEPLAFPSEPREIRLIELLGRYRGPLVLRLKRSGELEDERIVDVPLGLPCRREVRKRTEVVEAAPGGMVEIPAGEFLFRTEKTESLIPYPDHSEGRKVILPRFFLDRFPVTNAQFRLFLDAAGYQPEDSRNFLRHWLNGLPRSGEENHPVVHVSLEDARAYAAWAGKRLPTEEEWQYAAQGTDGRLWPWEPAPGGSRSAESAAARKETHNPTAGRTTPVDAFPQGASPFGAIDLVGNVWQMTDDEYDNGSHHFVVIRGGSFFQPKSSEWYLPGGPQALNRSQILLRVAPGFDRSATVGFRCVKDAAPK